MPRTAHRATATAPHTRPQGPHTSLHAAMGRPTRGGSARRAAGRPTWLARRAAGRQRWVAQHKAVGRPTWAALRSAVGQPRGAAPHRATDCPARRPTRRATPPPTLAVVSRARRGGRHPRSPPPSAGRCPWQTQAAEAVAAAHARRATPTASPLQMRACSDHRRRHQPHHSRQPTWCSRSRGAARRRLPRCGGGRWRMAVAAATVPTWREREGRPGGRAGAGRRRWSPWWP